MVTVTITSETMMANSTIIPAVEGLFGPELVSPDIAASLPAGYTLRALQKSDYENGFLDCLRVLTTVGDISVEKWNERYDWMNTQGKGGYYLSVITNETGRVVATGALIVERKLYVYIFPLVPMQP